MRVHFGTRHTELQKYAEVREISISFMKRTISPYFPPLDRPIPPASLQVPEIQDRVREGVVIRSSRELLSSPETTVVQLIAARLSARVDELSEHVP